MKELGPMVLERLGLHDETLKPFNDDVEAWLGHLGGDEPWLEDSENLRNRAQFVDAVRAIHDIISGAQDRACATTPVWLQRLVEEWTQEQALILTFNYDTLLELAFARAGKVRTEGELYRIALDQRKSLNPPLYPSGGDTTWPSATLLKLHGSINWLHSGEDAPPTERFVLREQHISARLYEDLTPFVVPPATSKSHYYNRTPLRVQWRRAAFALREATAIDVIGYSFPHSGAGTRTFLATCASTSADVTLVDPAEEARSRLPDVLPSSGEGRWFKSVADFVDATCGDLVTGWCENDGEDPGLYRDVNGEKSKEPLPDGGLKTGLAEWLRRDYPDASPREITLSASHIRALQLYGRRAPDTIPR
ncbi:SIR2 family protein [Sinomonas sp. JGH33]|uniref:SIR2 family protein n=1 Tax=Sinomonas terricola TaxID=3110330 RepID=A0ABU5TBW1_9MICC|nr:SIR2 family protein [Sinomonas sp. JGH33]MEA5456974.1 SIR2 family protein [Sinomonas sp. JGH33]